MSQINDLWQVVPVGYAKKTVLAMSLAIGLGGISTTPLAALSTSTLTFVLGVPETVACSYGTTPPCDNKSYNVTDLVGSWFAMDDGDGVPTATEKTPLSSLNGIRIGTTQAASNSHEGSINGTENPDIDNPWTFFGGTGMHQTTSAPTDLGNGKIDFGGWNVAWNGIASIPLVEKPPGTSITCSPSACSGTSNYTIDGAFHVSGGGFTTVTYFLNLEGTVLASGSPPVTEPDTANTIDGNTINLDVLANDSSADGLDTSSVAIDTIANPGLATPNTTDGTIDYDPRTAAAGTTDRFTYTVDSLAGAPSSPANVDVTIETNVAPVANNDTVTITVDAVENGGGKVEVDVLVNDTDANNDPGLPGGINVQTITILSQPTVGSCAVGVNGKVTYIQSLPAIGVSTFCSYDVADIDSANIPLTSNTATIAIDITTVRSEWPTGLDPNIIPFLVYEDGVPSKSGFASDRPGSGSYFSMDVSTSTTIYTTMTKGMDGGFVIGYDQIAGNSHAYAPSGNEIATIDLGWDFFGNTGMTFTKNGGIVGNPDGTLKFNGDPSVNSGQGRYQITWNGIPEIDLGGSPAFPEDLGFAVIRCSTGICADGATFDLSYRAHVPPGDPSGFGRVQYVLVMNGEVFFLDGRFQASSGTFSAGERLSTGDVPADPNSGIQCAGGCFDYTLNGVTGPTVAVVLPLNGGVPASTANGSSQMRVFRNGTWGNFDTSGNNSVLSAPFTKGGDFGTTCPPPGDVAYGTLTVGHQCLQITIEDNGPNDNAPAVGTIGSSTSGLAIDMAIDGTTIALSGTIKTGGGADICAMVLASGQFIFSCNPTGIFSVTDLPREKNGTVKRQIYADGFFPKIDILSDSSNDAVLMKRSGLCPGYNMPYDKSFVPGAAGKRVDITGKVLLQNSQTPICAMVLANGQHMFSCDGSGSYALNIPLDANGQFKLQVYADGFAPTIQTFDKFQTRNDVRMARAAECQ